MSTLSIRPVPASPVPGIEDAWPLVGREQYVQRLVAATAAGTPVMLLHGEPGIGKSRLLESVAGALDGSEHLVMRARGSYALASVPLGALAPAFAREPGATVDLAADPVTLFARVREVLATTAGARGVVFTIDDLGHLDSVSLTLLAQLVDTGDVQLIAAVQSGEPVPEPIARIGAISRSVRIDVAPLELGHVEELLTAALGPVAHRTAVELHAAASGNPLYLRELTIGAVTAGRLSNRDGVWQLSGDPVGTPALRDLVLTRLSALTERERAVVDLLALCEPLALDELSDEDTAVLAALEQRGLLAIDESTPRLRVLLAQPQYGFVIREAMPRIRAIGLLMTQAEALSGRELDPSDELRLALWRVRAGRPSDPELLVRAASLATVAGDQQTAQTLIAAAVEAGPATPEILLLHGEVLWTLGRADEAIAALTRAAQLDAAQPSSEALTAAIATLRASVLGGDALGQLPGLHVLDEAQEHVPTQAYSMALSRAVLLLNLERAHEALEQIVLAQSVAGDSPVDRAVLAMSRALPLSALGRDTEALADAEAALAYALSPGSAVARQRAQLVSATVLIQSGALERARETVVDSLYESIRRDDELATRYNEFLMGRVFFEMGRLEPASRWLRDTVSGSLQRSPASLRESALSMQSTIASWRGDVESARHAFEQLIPGLLPDNSPASLAQAWIAAGDGDVDRAADLLLARAEESARRGQRFVAGTLLQEICRLGSTALAARAADAFTRLLPDQDSALLRLRAATAVALAEPSEAGLAAAAVDWQQRGYLLHAAELHTQAAIQARAAGRGREATARLVTVGELVLATGGAATPLLRFAEAAEPLTPREREIATLAAQGLSSNEIAARLFLSPRTVNNHLQSTYSKLGIRGRHEFGGA